MSDEARDKRFDRMRAWLEQRRAEGGWCVKCGARKPREDRKTCGRCNAATRRWESKQKERGLCIKCIEPRVAGSCYCQYHREYHAKFRSRQNAACKALGICQYCGTRDARPGQTWCDRCRAVQRQSFVNRMSEREAKGKCRRCGRKAISGRKFCETCREKYLARFDRMRRGIKRCLTCGEFGPPGKLYCSDACMKSA